MDIALLPALPTTSPDNNRRFPGSAEPLLRVNPYCQPVREAILFT
jgi:hypothetical protein